MSDIENAIESVIEVFNFIHGDFVGTDDFDEQEWQQKRDNIIKLLKEHEAVKPTLIREGRNKHYNDYVCPRCDNNVVYEQNYCSECGIPFLWEGL